MSWRELIGRRGRRVRHYLNNLPPGQAQGHFYGSDLHYEAAKDSGIYNTPIDTRPQRVTTAEFDGWRCTAAGWHYTLGQPTDKGSDGWVGFGGRQGEHWLLSRLVRVGYLHWTSRTWTNIGGAPTYDRANLSQTQGYNDVGPEGETERIYTSASATWANLWAFGAGYVGITWRVGGDGLKEDVHIDAAAREWIAANAPPLSPPTQTWFGFLFRLDLSDIPKWVKDGVEQDSGGDFEATTGVEIRNALDRVLAFLPLSHVFASEGSAELRKRLWLDGDGNHYLLIGVRCDTLAALPPGDLDFDPSLTQYAESSDGYVSASDASWATLRTKSSGYEAVSNVSYFERTNEARCDAGPFYYAKRGFFVFNTASLDDDCIITAGTLSIAGYSYNETSVSVQKGTQGDTLDTGDFSSFSGSYYDYVSSWALGSYNDFTLDAQGLADISKTGNTYYCTREYAHDYVDSAPAEGFAYRSGCYFSENTDVTYDPKLVVEYTTGLFIDASPNNTSMWRRGVRIV